MSEDLVFAILNELFKTLFTFSFSSSWLEPLQEKSIGFEFSQYFDFFFVGFVPETIEEIEGMLVIGKPFILGYSCDELVHSFRFESWVVLLQEDYSSSNRFDPIRDFYIKFCLQFLHLESSIDEHSMKFLSVSNFLNTFLSQKLDLYLVNYVFWVLYHDFSADCVGRFEIYEYLRILIQKDSHQSEEFNPNLFEAE